MAEAVYILGARVQTSDVLDSPRHSALVRITHWIFTLSFFGLVVTHWPASSTAAKWTGVPLSYVLNLAGVSPKAKYVASFPYDESWDSLDLADAFHPQTFLAYGLNGQDLPTHHGAPIRLRVARQLGYKSVKYLSHITVTDNLKNIGTGKRSSQLDYGYSWYAGI